MKKAKNGGGYNVKRRSIHSSHRNGQVFGCYNNKKKKNNENNKVDNEDKRSDNNNNNNNISFYELCLSLSWCFVISFYFEVCLGNGNGGNFFFFFFNFYVPF